MTIRLPRNLSTQLETNSGASALEAEIFAEHAASLGHHGKLVEAAMIALEGCDDTDKDRLLDEAAHAVYNFFVIREAIGINNHDQPIKFYKITPSILARMGSARVSED